VRDDQGALLVGYSNGIRPAVWFTELWPELTLSFASMPVCRKPMYPDALALRVTLANESDSCTLDSGTAKCCRISNVLYEVECPDAWHSVSAAQPDYANILVAREGVLVSAP
jgi:hypothetical protein